MREPTVVIGIGNRFRRDDGIGPAVIDLLRDRISGVRFATCDGEPTTLIDLWGRAGTAIVVHAVRSTDGEAGRVYRLGLHHPAATRAGIAGSHAAELGAAVALARGLDLMPAALLALAVQVSDVGSGVGLSPAADAAARRLADEIAGLIAARSVAPEVT